MSIPTYLPIAEDAEMQRNPFLVEGPLSPEAQRFKGDAASTDTHGLDIGRWCQREDFQPSRMALNIKGDVVTYAMQGVLTMFPLRMPVSEFKAWVDGDG